MEGAGWCFVPRGGWQVASCFFVVRARASSLQAATDGEDGISRPGVVAAGNVGAAVGHCVSGHPLSAAHPGGAGINEKGRKRSRRGAQKEHDAPLSCSDGRCLQSAGDGGAELLFPADSALGSRSEAEQRYKSMGTTGGSWGSLGYYNVTMGELLQWALWWSTRQTWDDLPRCVGLGRMVGARCSMLSCTALRGLGCMRLGLDLG